MTLKMDSEGDIILCPVAEWDIRVVADIAVLLAMMVQGPPGGPGELERVQVVLTLSQALDLRDALNRCAQKILGQVPGGPIQ